MEEKKTVQYKRTMRGTMGAGASALFNGNGRRFYVLEHRDASKYHKAGESQKIIVDQVELGRQPDCQVRFDDETWDIVSRRHAAIVRALSSMGKRLKRNGILLMVMKYSWLSMVLALDSLYQKVNRDLFQA